MIPVDPAAFTMAASVTNTLSFLHHSHPGSVFYLFLVLYFLIFITQKTRGHSEDIKGVWKLIRTFSFTLISGSRSHHFRCQAPCSPRALLPSPSAISSPSFTFCLCCLQSLSIVEEREVLIEASVLFLLPY